MVCDTLKILTLGTEVSAMSMTAHIAELERKHQALDKRIADELAHPNKDTVRIAALKRQKLVLKDEILRLREAPGTGKPSLH
ncbi:MAG: hypothetical protein FD175_1866 [Beijerinckiaceae bacterium]|nr:MAG: hypothetical protein FD175_1866 [Beijerinckiaceae bacterium]